MKYKCSDCNNKGVVKKQGCVYCVLCYVKRFQRELLHIISTSR